LGNALNIHIYPSTFLNESRILKIVRSLQEHRIFQQLVVLALWKDGLPKYEVLGDGIEVWRIAPVIGGSMEGRLGRMFKVIGWHLGVLWALRGVKVRCFNCHSLAVLPLSVMVKSWKRCVLVYEPHELESETAGLQGMHQWLMRRVERALISRADAVCVVNRSISNWYIARYGLKKAWVVRNVPHKSDVDPVRTGHLRRALGLATEAQLFLYQGLLAPGRGVSLLINVFSKLPNVHLALMGYGEMEGQVRAASHEHENIHFMPAVPPEQVKDYTVDADVGIALIEKVCLSYYLSLPNKLFEYAACGVPMVVSDFPEMGRFVHEYDCGWTVEPEEQALLYLIKHLTSKELSSKRANTRNSVQTYCWQEEERVLLAMYRSLGFADTTDGVKQVEVMGLRS
jgi:glycosyltransferase involved in cell wall biosynthesis